MLRKGNYKDKKKIKIPDQYDYLLGDILTKSYEDAITYNAIVKLTMCTFTRQRE